MDGGEDYRIVAVSPRHCVRLASEYMPRVERAPTRDFVVRTVAKEPPGPMLRRVIEPRGAPPAR
jgi:hypothetical protein